MTAVAYIQNRFPEPTQTFVRKEVAGLVDKGAKVFVVSSRRSTETAPAGVELLVLEDLALGRAARDHMAMAVRHPKRYTLLLLSAIRAGRGAAPWSAYAPTISRELDRRGVRHVHTHFATRAARLAQIVAEDGALPRSVTVHAADIYGGNADFDQQVRGARLATVTEYNRRYLAGRGYAHVSLVRCGVDDQLLHRDSVQTPDPDRVSVVTVGRLIPKKGHDHLIRAIAQLRSRGSTASLTIVGDGPLRLELGELARKLGVGDAVEFAGSLTHDETIELVAASSVFALLCVEGADGDVDGLPVAILEAAALGVPIVAGDVSGVSEFVDSTTGWLVDPSEVDVVCRSIVEAATPGESEQRISCARARVSEQFTLSAQVNGVLELFEVGGQS